MEISRLKKIKIKKSFIAQIVMLLILLSITIFSTVSLFISIQRTKKINNQIYTNQSIILKKQNILDAISSLKQRQQTQLTSPSASASLEKDNHQPQPNISINN